MNSGDAQSAAPAAPEASDPEESANILLVDDRPDNLLALESLLAPLGQRLVRASSGPEALRHLLSEDFALILLDVQMPGMDGFETAALIKERERSRHIPIIFVTAISKDEGYVFRGYASGAVDYLFKPVDPEILQSKVAVFVDLFRKEQKIRRQVELLHQSQLREARRTLEEAAMVRQHALLRDVLASVTEGRLSLCESAAQLPRPFPSPGPILPLERHSLSELRHRAQAVCQAQGFPDDRWQDLVTAVSEVAMNAVVHGGGGEARIHADPGRAVQVWIRDRGKGIAVESLHRATLERGYTTAGTMGHGFWLSLQTVDCIFLLTGASGTTVVLEQHASRPELGWLGEA